MHKQWQWRYPIKQPAAAQRHPQVVEAHLGHRPVRCVVAGKAAQITPRQSMPAKADRRCVAGQHDPLEIRGERA